MGKHGWKVSENVGKLAEMMGECSMNDFTTCRLANVPFLSAAAFLQLGQGTRVSTTSKM